MRSPTASPVLRLTSVRRGGEIRISGLAGVRSRLPAVAAHEPTARSWANRATTRGYATESKGHSRAPPAPRARGAMPAISRPVGPGVARCRAREGTARPRGQSHTHLSEGDGSDCRAGGAADSRGSGSACPARGCSRAASAFDVGAARRAHRAIGLRKTPESEWGASGFRMRSAGRVARCRGLRAHSARPRANRAKKTPEARGERLAGALRFGAERPRAPPGAECALNVGGAWPVVAIQGATSRLFGSNRLEGHISGAWKGLMLWHHSRSGFLGSFCSLPVIAERRLANSNRIAVSASWIVPASHRTKCRPKPS
jgi:hypothetical protein